MDALKWPQAENPPLAGLRPVDFAQGVGQRPVAGWQGLGWHTNSLGPGKNPAKSRVSWADRSSHKKKLTKPRDIFATFHGMLKTPGVIELDWNWWFYGEKKDHCGKLL